MANLDLRLDRRSLFLSGALLIATSLLGCTDGLKSSPVTMTSSQVSLAQNTFVARSGAGVPAQVASGSTAMHCTALSSYSKTTLNASATLQNCIDQAAGGTLLIPPGVYTLQNRIQINGPIAIASDSIPVDGSIVQCGLSDVRCAHFVAANEIDFSAPQSNWMGVFNILGTDVTLQSLILDGNKANRQTGAAVASCRGGNGAAGHLVTANTGNLSVLGSVFENAICGSGFAAFVVQGGDFENNIFQANGTHTQLNLWSDGLTMEEANHVTVVGNTFVDNTDIEFVMGGCQNCTISDNSFAHSGDPNQAAFGEIHIQSWPATSGNYTGTAVSGNTIDCHFLCGMGIGLGSKAWGPLSGGSSYGATVTGNTISRALIAINADAISGQTVIQANQINVAAIGAMGCEGGGAGTIAITAINISPDSQSNLAASSQADVANFAKNAASPQLVTNKTYPNCVPDVESAQITTTYNLPAGESITSCNSGDSLQNGACIAVPTTPSTGPLTDEIQQAYHDILGRPADSAGLQFYLGLMEAGQSLSAIRLAIASGPESAGLINGMYQTVLGRAADASGAASAITAMQNGGSLTTLRQAMAVSAEANRNITALFQANLNAAPTAAQLQQYEQQLAATMSLAQVTTEIVKLGKITAFVTHLYSTAFNRAPDAGGLASWIQQYESGNVGCASLTDAFLTSSEDTQRVQAAAGSVTAQSEYLNQLYRVAFWRAPDTAGDTYWYGILKAHLGTAVPQVESAFLQSPEFLNQCAAAGINP